MKTPVYMDYAATTPTDPAVVAVMTHYTRARPCRQLR